MSLILRNGLILEDNNLIQKDIKIEDGKIIEIGYIVPSLNDEIIDCTNLLITPGFVDVHVHLREPGLTHKETIKTGTMAAAAGGYTTICAMPNVKPAPDSLENLKVQLEKINEDALVKVLPYGCITTGGIGHGDLVNFEELAPYVIGFSDDGKGVQGSSDMFKTMIECQKLDKIIASHCEDEALITPGGCVHLGEFSQKNNLIGISSASESAIVARDVMIAKETGARYHVCHISAAESVEMIRLGKKLGANVTCEVTPHHLLMCDTDIIGDDGNYKMNPPLRSHKDREALIKGLIDGTIDMIATDHAPHTNEEKSRGLANSFFGIVGLETAFSLLYTHLVKKDIITLSTLLDLMSTNPRKIFKLEDVSLNVGSSADLTIIDLEKKYIIDADNFKSMGKNTPFNDFLVNGLIELTIVDGKIVYRGEEYGS